MWLFWILLCTTTSFSKLVWGYQLKMKYYYDASFFVVNQGSPKQIEKTLEKLNKYLNKIFEDLVIDIEYDYNNIEAVLNEKFQAQPSYLEKVRHFERREITFDHQYDLFLLVSAFNKNER